MEKEDNSSAVHGLLTQLAELQSNGYSIYPNGVFPSQRYHPFLPYKREDDNLFFTVSVVHILQGCIDSFSESERKIAESIISAELKTHALFRNKDGLDTYNFWQTAPSRHFPNGWLMHRFKHFQIPDDVDDTTLVYLTENADKERVSKLREKLKQHANLAYKPAFNPLPKYRDFKCYSTFFGQKMYIEFDVCVLSNLMRLILRHYNEEELNEYDCDTLEFICSVIEHDEHLTLPFYSAPNYPTTELILYHVSRLIPHLPYTYRGRIEQRIQNNISSALNSQNGMRRILLENAALKLGITVSDAEFDATKLINDSSFYFFHAGMITAFEKPIAQKLASNSLFHLRYTSKALNGALLIENHMLKRGITPQ